MSSGAETDAATASATTRHPSTVPDARCTSRTLLECASGWSTASVVAGSSSRSPARRGGTAAWSPRWSRRAPRRTGVRAAASCRCGDPAPPDPFGRSARGTVSDAGQHHEHQRREAAGEELRRAGRRIGGRPSQPVADDEHRGHDEPHQGTPGAEHAQQRCQATTTNATATDSHTIGWTAVANPIRAVAATSVATPHGARSPGRPGAIDSATFSPPSAATRPACGWPTTRPTTSGAAAATMPATASGRRRRRSPSSNASWASRPHWPSPLAGIGRSISPWDSARGDDAVRAHRHHSQFVTATMRFLGR